jgi:ethanolamine transporter EutH
MTLLVVCHCRVGLVVIQYYTKTLSLHWMAWTIPLYIYEEFHSMIPIYIISSVVLIKLNIKQKKLIYPYLLFKKVYPYPTDLI